MFFIPARNSEDSYDFKTGKFALQPQRNFDELGFVKMPMSEDDQTRFFFCALAAGVPGLDDVVGFEPHNPLLDDWEDVQSKPDLSKEESDDDLNSSRTDFPVCSSTTFLTAFLLSDPSTTRFTNWLKG
jgi:hypothetical protein